MWQFIKSYFYVGRSKILKKNISSFYTQRRERHNFCTFYTKNYTHSTESYIIVIIVNFIDLGIYFLSSEERREKSKLKAE